MKPLFIFSLLNQRGAGPLQLSENLVKVCLETDLPCYIFRSKGSSFSLCRQNNVKIISIPLYGALHYLARGFLDIIFVPLLSLYVNPKAHIVLGNYNFNPFNVRKKLLIHHPYLLSNILQSSYCLPLARVFKEYVRKYIFMLSVFLCNRNTTYIVQTSSMHLKLLRFIPDSDIQVLPNPISLNLQIDRSDFDLLSELGIPNETYVFSYISRFYPHKNHIALFEIIDSLRIKANFQFVFVVTVDPSIQKSFDFLNLASTSYPEIINLGEINQSYLYKLYKRSHCSVFLSERETFGNPIIESQYFQCPVVGFDHDYFRDLVHSSLTCATSNAELSDILYRSVVDKEFYDLMLRECNYSIKSSLDPFHWLQSLIA